MGNGKSRLTLSNYPDLQPTRYTLMEELGEGVFGKVWKCLDTDTGDIVAMKLPKFKDVSIQEATILRQLMDKNMDDCNIVKFYDCFNMRLGPALVFEMLGIALKDHLNANNSEPMMLDDIGIITKQLATALNALKSVGVIHTDIKPDNIMLVNQTRPLKVKLIDFGLAITRSQARPGTILQTLCLRAPEILLGLPFSEAIDMWALGQVVFTMLFNCLLIRGRFEYEAMKLIVDLLGVPPDDLLNQGTMAHLFFMKTESDTWRLKTPEEFLGKTTDVTLNGYRFSSLDDLKTLYRQRNYKADAGQTEQCIELLKAMLTMDESQRIAPLDVLTHPFITQADHQDQQDHQDQKRSTDEGTVPPPTAPPSRVIQVRPAAAESTLQLEDELEDEERADSLQDGPNETSKVSCDTSPPQSPAMTSGQDSEDEHQKKKKKKKKNIFRRIWSVMKRTFCCNQVGVVWE